MSDTLAQNISDFLQNKIPDELIIFIISLLPVLELRGGIFIAHALEMPLIPAFIICYIGNMLPIPFILLFIRKIFRFLRDKRFFGKIVRKLEDRSKKKRTTIDKYGLWGLLFFVAIPLPGTGGWTGALVAALMKLPVRNSLFVIAIGVFIAGVIMSTAIYGTSYLLEMIGIV